MSTRNSIEVDEAILNDSRQMLDGRQCNAMTVALTTQNAPRKLVDNAKDERLAAQRRKVKRVIVAVALLLILTSVVLVGGMLAMSTHIDNMVRQNSNIASATPRFSSPANVSQEVVR